MTDLKWFKSTASNGRCTCVSVAITPDRVYTRHSSGQGAMSEWTHPEWKAFLAGVRNNEFDL